MQLILLRIWVIRQLVLFNFKWGRMGKIKKIIKYFVYAVLAVLVLLVLASALPIPGGVKTFVVRSGSMEPSIKTGGLVIVFPSSDYKVGDVITYGAASKTKTPTTHRIVEINSSGIITKGDANNAPDARIVSKREIIGKVFLSVPLLGYVISAAQQPYGFIALIVLPAAIIIFDEVKKIIKEIKKVHPVK